MKLTVLVDNNTITDSYYKGEPALSYHIEDGGKQILFDTGYSGIFIENAEKSGINLLMTDYIVLSHAHIDHTGGLPALMHYHEAAENSGAERKRPVLIAHPDIFRTIEAEGFGNIGMPVSKEEVENFADIILTNSPFKITERSTYLGETETLFDFESSQPTGFIPDGERDRMKPDPVKDDSAIVYSGKDGIFIITGCSHHGICSVVEKAKQVCPADKVTGVIGGFHLLNETEERLNKTAEYLSLNISGCIFPAHCTDLAAKTAILQKNKVRETGSGCSYKLL
ncbi:MBL fold metallo-hydrolase [Methanoplanus sp. FWC-SCC4]|uniref:MBL fold metallo-hydrolase n=1 Tax=Methanochimaera problematica TaxID=2609417 RepID=A0AA97FAX6_9EURY|nr:MBL fold metallo-hydrolase [Methanoplanus sp. FWC-SCC4]WOF15212.1 MBL fold metallo-hydrolase [Methanoplanus sp. FWC-SCC4]